MGLRRGRSEYHKAELFSCPVFGSQETLDQSWEERNGGIQHSACVVWSRGAAHPVQAKLMNSFSDHGNSHGLGIKSLCFVGRGLNCRAPWFAFPTSQAPCVPCWRMLSHGPPSSGRECGDRDVLSTRYYVPAACVMYCAPSKQT